MKKKLCAFLLVLSCVIGVSGCSNTGTTEITESISTDSGSADSSTFTVGLALEPSSLDPIHNYAQDTMLCVNNLYDALLDVDSDGNLQPMLAKSWEQVDDLTYVYEIRDDVCFSDGTPMTMDDVIYSLERYWKPEYAADTNWMYASVESIEQTGDWELTVTLSQPDSAWQYVPSTSAGQIVCKAYVEEQGEKYGTTEGGVLGTSAYKLDAWTAGSEIVLSKNEYYWNKEEAVPFDKVVFKIITDSSSRILAANSGQVNLIAKIPSQELSQYDQNAVDVYSVTGTNVKYAAMNTQKAPFDDVNFRKAVAYAVDTDAIKEALIGENGKTASTLCFDDALYMLDEDSWSSFADKISGDYSYDVDKAKEYLAKSAYPDGYDITYVCLEGESSIAQMVQAYLAEIGINVTVVEAQASDYYAQSYGMTTDENGFRDYNMFEFEWYSDFPDPSATMLCLLNGYNCGEGGTNAAEYSNPDVDALFDEQTASSDVKERSDALLEISDIVNEDIPYLNFYYENNNYILSKGYSYEFSPFWLFTYRVKDVKINQ
ncbi:MAG: ABC transporter substrate-binding protein [Wujia sp.]